MLGTLEGVRFCNEFIIFKVEFKKKNLNNTLIEFAIAFVAIG